MIELLAPAKINLFLSILGRREDGYHELVTRMQKIDLCDHLNISTRRSPGIHLSCSDKTLASGKNNLVVIAAEKFLKAAGLIFEYGLDIHLEKRIPVAAGLGGGSSDAGAVLKGLNTLFKTPLSAEQLVEIATTIGADVPFFTVDYPSAIASGIGERLSAAPDIEGFWIILVNPGIPVSTRAIFENYTLTTVPKNSKVPSFQKRRLTDFSVGQMHNDLEPVAILSQPVIETIKLSLLENGAVAAMMSGSGPTVFGLFPTEQYTEPEINTLVDRFTMVYGRRVYAARPFAGA
ncbi:MAG: 4-(cytidine 5'-diphospho)-2-C-methyl-D-erythritol kinase [Desulfocapsaceae bacterium]|jgi:4-diphosphocytidyl-2-C-methyl-D-erythritol kinase|nr:4-(cytidine 5'-diphospho)-2-C-methyl-D-erythritol kinase [Desulfocapsaceae bacterium]